MGKPCKHCEGTNHTSLMCFKKKRVPPRAKPDLTWQNIVDKWKALNPGPWECYLHISDMCLGQLDASTLTLDHRIPKSRGNRYKYDINNLSPACAPCNGLKGSRTLESLKKDYPHLLHIV